MQRNAIWLLVLLLWVRPACADLMSAQAAYQKGDFPKAFQDFRELAEIGQPMAQLNLAILYSRGEGARQSDIYAYAWASLAAQNGLEKAQSMADRLRPLLAPGSDRIAADIKAQFGNAVLDAKLNPRIADSDLTEGWRKRCSPIHAYMPSYPVDAARSGLSGQVYVEFSLLADGRARMPRVISALPRGIFEAAARESLLHSEFAPAPTSEAVPCNLFFRFNGNRAAEGYPQLLAYVKQTQLRAEAGDPQAQMLYGMLLAGLPQLNRPPTAAMPWFLKSAQAGLPIAQYQVGYSLLKGWGCDCDVNKGLEWLRRAAQAGQPDAEVRLAEYALHGNPDEERLRQAKLWLEQAAASGNRDGKLYLAALLATSDATEAHDPKRAIELVNEVFKGVKDDPTAFEIRAAAQASAGDFPGAVKSEAKALSLAQKLHWDTAPMNQRMSSYDAHQPWRGLLLDF
jgi:TPR repeat protein